MYIRILRVTIILTFLSGRQFYKCSKPMGSGCNFFLWAEESVDGGSGGGGGGGGGGGAGGSSGGGGRNDGNSFSQGSSNWNSSNANG